LNGSGRRSGYHSDAEVEHLTGPGADTVIMGEREIARGITEHVLASAAGPESARS
jgi:CPA2 family monovalent cation:H+ antiporter-2